MSKWIVRRRRDKSIMSGVAHTVGDKLELRCESYSGNRMLGHFKLSRRGPVLGNQFLGWRANPQVPHLRLAAIVRALGFTDVGAWEAYMNEIRRQSSDSTAVEMQMHALAAKLQATGCRI